MPAAYYHWGRVRTLLREQPDGREVAELGVAACMQLLMSGVRVGLGLEEANVVLEEGRAFAGSIADPISALHLSLVRARVVCGTGDVATYLELTCQNERTALDAGDEAALALAQMWMVDALGTAARFPEALRKADEVLSLMPRHVWEAQKIVGSHPAGLVVLWRGYCLYWMGRVQEGLDALALAQRMAEEDDVSELVLWVSFFAAEARYLIHDVDGALASARQSEEISRRLGDAAGDVAPAQLALGYAHLVAGRLADAVEAARESLRLYGLADKAGAGFPAALLAEALLASGDLPAAQASAEQAIALCRQLLSGHHEARAHGVLARAILRSGGVAAREAAEAVLANAAKLIERTGAQILAPALCEWRAELAAALGDDAASIRLLTEARDHFERMGAPFQMQRLDNLLSASRS